MCVLKCRLSAVCAVILFVKSCVLFCNLLFSNRLPYIVLRGRWRNIIVANMHTPSEEKSDELKDSFYEELEQVF